MAVTAPKRTRLRIGPWAAALLMLITLQQPVFADRAGDVLAQISSVGTALTSGDATEAMEPFDKSFVNYDKLSGYFEGLSNYQVENEVDVTDEQDTDTGTTLTITWTLTLTDPSTNHSEGRTADINVRLVSRGGKWKIVDFSPIDIFNPLQKRTSKP